LSPPMTVLGI